MASAEVSYLINYNSKLKRVSQVLLVAKMTHHIKVFYIAISVFILSIIKEAIKGLIEKDIFVSCHH